MLTVQAREILPLLERNHLELRIGCCEGDWDVSVVQPVPCPCCGSFCCVQSTSALVRQGVLHEELWQGLDEALAWIFKTYNRESENPT